MSHEKELDRIRKEPANKVCPNCQKEDKLGFDAVCWAFKTFVCSTCKSSHQAFSHRCKSVRMSNWTREEVDKLKTENGGGNSVCTATWLGNLEARGGRRPRAGDEEKVFKAFVDQTYNHRAFYKEGGVPAEPAIAAPPHRQASAAPALGASMANGMSLVPPGPNLPPAVEKVKSAPSAGGDSSLLGGDLLAGLNPPPSGSVTTNGSRDFGFGDLQSAGLTPVSAASPAASPFQADFGSDAGDGFGDFASASTNVHPPSIAALTPPPPPSAPVLAPASNSAASSPPAQLASSGLLSPDPAPMSTSAKAANIMAAFNAGATPAGAPGLQKTASAPLDPADFGGQRTPNGMMGPRPGMGPMSGSHMTAGVPPMMGMGASPMGPGSRGPTGPGAMGPGGTVGPGLVGPMGMNGGVGMPTMGGLGPMSGGPGMMGMGIGAGPRPMASGGGMMSMGGFQR